MVPLTAPNPGTLASRAMAPQEYASRRTFGGTRR